MKKQLSLVSSVLCTVLLYWAAIVNAQTITIQDNFTGKTTAQSWLMPAAGDGSLNTVCLTAGNGSAPPNLNPNTVPVPACTSFSGGRSADVAGSGALRLTDSVNYEHGAIISDFVFPSNSGLQVTFTTYSYGGTGADGINFFLADGGTKSDGTGVAADGTGEASVGGTGGSLGYSCSDVNAGYDGVMGGYLGLGIDEYGNYLNGTNYYSGASTSTASNININSKTGSFDNTATTVCSPNTVTCKIPNRIGLRGAGSINWQWLNAHYPTYYPSTVTAAADKQQAVQKTCYTGYVQQGTFSHSAWTWTQNAASNIPVADYAAIPNGFLPLPTSGPHAQPLWTSSTTRATATPISYKLLITADGYLSLWMAYGTGSEQAILTNQSITASNGPLPQYFRFGFTGSTGGSNNVHEITCFQAVPADVSSSSAGLNVQSGQIRTGSQAYSAYYNSRNWSGDVVAYDLLEDPTTQAISVSSTANWDGSCTLTGGTCNATGVTGMTAQGSANRTILSWNGSRGVPFQWASTPGTGTLTTTQQSALNAGDSAGSTRLAYLRGDTSLEISKLNSNGSYTANTSGIFRTRTSILGDVIDSSPVWVGPPLTTSYTQPWQDKLYPAQTLPENATSAQTYTAYESTYAGRLNLVYVGANDGLLHAFRAGSYDAAGNYINNAATPNDGREMLAYMPGAVVNTIHNSTVNGLDYSSPQYGHNFFVDAAPGTGEVFFNGAWHTWLIGGLGPGGTAIYALDITNPSNFSESNASSIVIGEWTNTTLTNLGQTYGTPVITRFHNGQWGAIFGNGLNSASGVAGVYIMLIDPTSGAISFKFLTTGSGTSTTPNGIAYASSVDLDYDNITDYVYAGDMYGQLWRFDLTSSNPANWGVPTATGAVATATTPGVPMFQTNSGQPISTKVMVSVVAPSSATALSRVMVMFGTGHKVPQSLTSAATYATGTQDIYDVWDWNMSTWNSLSSIDYATLGGTNAPTAVLGKTNLTQQTITNTYGSTDQNSTLPARTISSNPVCWKGSTVCSGGASVNNKFGAYLDLPSKTVGSGSSATIVYEQAIYSPTIAAGAFVINTAVPETNAPMSCTVQDAQSWTYGLSVVSGGATTVNYFKETENGVPVSAIGINAVGTASLLNGDVLITQTNIGSGGSSGGGSGSGSGSGGLPGSTGGTSNPNLGLTPITPELGSGARINWAQLR